MKSKSVKLKFLKNYLGWYNVEYLADSVHEMRIWPVENKPELIRWNEGMGYWNTSELGVDVEILQELDEPKSQGVVE